MIEILIGFCIAIGSALVFLCAVHAGARRNYEETSDPGRNRGRE